MTIVHYEQRALKTFMRNVPVVAFQQRLRPAVDGAGCELGYLLLAGPRISLHKTLEIGYLT